MSETRADAEGGRRSVLEAAANENTREGGEASESHSCWSMRLTDDEEGCYGKER